MLIVPRYELSTGTKALVYTSEESMERVEINYFFCVVNHSRLKSTKLIKTHSTHWQQSAIKY